MILIVDLLNVSGTFWKGEFKDVFCFLPICRLIASLSDGLWLFTPSVKKGGGVMHETTSAVWVENDDGGSGVNKGSPHWRAGPEVPGRPVTEVMDDVFTAGRGGGAVPTHRSLFVVWLDDKSPRCSCVKVQLRVRKTRVVAWLTFSSHVMIFSSRCNKNMPGYGGKFVPRVKHVCGTGKCEIFVLSDKLFSLSVFLRKLITNRSFTSDHWD